MVDEFKQFERSIRSITSQDYNTAYPLVGKIIGYSSSMEFCDVEVRINEESKVYANVPAHGFPVVGSTGIIHFHNGNLEQPVCDCAYRLNPPNTTLSEYYTNECYNWLNNGNFQRGSYGFNVAKGLDKIEIYEGSNITGSMKSCILREQGDMLEVDVDISECEGDYFKFQCNYRGEGTLKIECMDNDTKMIIPTMPYTIGCDYRIWSSPKGRFNWVFNKEAYPRVTLDDIIHENIKIRITNLSDNISTMTVPDGQGGHKEVPAFHAMMLDGLLVYEENGDRKYYPSVEDQKTKYSLQ